MTSGCFAGVMGARAGLGVSTVRPALLVRLLVVGGVADMVGTLTNKPNDATTATSRTLASRTLA